MNNILTVIEREYLIRVKKKSFLIMTIIAPFFMVLIVLLPLILSKFGSDKQVVAVIDKTGQYMSLLKDSKDYKFQLADKTLEEYSKIPENKQKVTAILDIKKDLLQDPSAISIYSYKQIPDGLSTYVNTCLHDYLYHQKINAYHIKDLEKIVQDLKVDLDIQTFKWNKEGETSATSNLAPKIIGYVFMFICFMFVFMYGQMVFSSVMEEKKNRIMEVLISSVKPFDFMMGKIIGIGLVGLTQLLIWSGLLAAFYFILQFVMMGGIYSAATIEQMSSSGAMVGSTMDSNISEYTSIIAGFAGLNITEICLMFVLYFIGGYLFYASIFAALGSAFNSEEDSSQVLIPISIIEIFSLYAAMGSVSNPEGDLAFWCSVIPFTSPIVMMVRLAYDVPLWQEILSLGLLFLSFIGSTWIGAKIYRVGILMYGKKPSLKEIIRWVNYK